MEDQDLATLTLAELDAMQRALDAQFEENRRRRRLVRDEFARRGGPPPPAAAPDNSPRLAKPAGLLARLLRR